MQSQFQSSKFNFKVQFQDSNSNTDEALLFSILRRAQNLMFKVPVPRHNHCHLVCVAILYT